MLARTVVVTTALVLAVAAMLSTRVLGSEASAAGTQASGTTSQIPGDTSRTPGSESAGMEGMNHGSESTGATAMHEHMMEMMEQMHGGEGGMGGGMGGEMGMASSHSSGPGAEVLLGISEVLDLTPDQVDALHGLHEREVATREAHVEAVAVAREEATRALEGNEPDLDAFEVAVRREAEHAVEMKLAPVRAAAEARSLLTESQRHLLRKLNEARLLGGMQGMQHGSEGHGAGGQGNGDPGSAGHVAGGGGAGGAHDH